MKRITQQYLTGERALYNSRDLAIFDTTFADGESPLKESRNINLHNCIFKWKYPLWYCHDVNIEKTSLLDAARSGIWYTDNINIKDSFIEAPKTFRRSSNITLTNVSMPNALESFWNCKSINLNNVEAKGDYFGLNSENIKITDFRLDGNYAFDGAKNLEIENAIMLSKDSFWNCENVVIKDSVIIGEYIGWNSKNVVFINCTIDSIQPLCYMEKLKMVNCKLLNANLSFEYTTVEAEINSKIDSVKNPISGFIKAKSIDELIMDEKLIDPAKTKIEVKDEI